jgi:hypothetical protein
LNQSTVAELVALQIKMKAKTVMMEFHVLVNDGISLANTTTEELAFFPFLSRRTGWS